MDKRTGIGAETTITLLTSLGGMKWHTNGTRDKNRTYKCMQKLI